ncbi:MAG: hypothetical protein Q9159_005526 [Coniocarpon cinnabarinum]
MLNLIKNPNITSSHLFRADIMYDSENDASFAPLHETEMWERGLRDVCKLAKHMKPSYKPRPLRISGWTMTRLIVREMVPRNPSLDKPLAQTCCLYELSSQTHDGQSHETVDARDAKMLFNGLTLHTPVAPSGKYLVIYVPHVSSEDDIPYYHPKVKALAFFYEWSLRHPLANGLGLDDSSPVHPPSGQLSIHPSNFSESLDGPERAERVITNLLTTIARHGQGRLDGYEKRVQHDTIVPQQRFQNTYTRLKTAYASRLVKDWREVTDPTKHVFEDLGIAAFLMELWRYMYGIDPEAESNVKVAQAQAGGLHGFVDIGCGNGVLVAILRWEGYDGWGFDVRRRKSWEAFESEQKAHVRLQEAVLIPKILNEGQESTSGIHSGQFPPGTFIISNHADELTCWTPILARLSHNAPFLAIPCCGHDFSGARTRFPRQKPTDATDSGEPNASAYQTLCQYVGRVSRDAGYEIQREYLRIPSTRNLGIIGTPSGSSWPTDRAGKDITGTNDKPNENAHVESQLKALIQHEMKSMPIHSIAAAWQARVDKLKSVKVDAGH